MAPTDELAHQVPKIERSLSDYDTILVNPRLWSFSILGYFDVANSFGKRRETFPPGH